MKRFWKSRGVFTPVKARRNNPLRTVFGNQGAKPFMMTLNCRSLSRSSKACFISSGSYGLISLNSSGILICCS